MLVKGASGPAVKQLQRQLLALGYDLPRFGDDGDLGGETLSAVAAFVRDHGGADPDPAAVSNGELAAIARAHEARESAPPPAELVDLTGAHPGKVRIRRRSWREITGITLHQTACNLGGRAERWFSVPVQVGVTKAGGILLLNPIEYMTYHGNGLNGSTVGIEIDGRYAGVEGDLKTFWRPKGDTASQPEVAPEAQLAAARAAVRWICEEVARHGGKVARIYAHRQASDMRRSDPGSRIWQEVGLWAQRELGLSDGGPRFTVGSGLPIPASWDISRGEAY